MENINLNFDDEPSDQRGGFSNMSLSAHAPGSGYHLLAWADQLPRRDDNPASGRVLFAMARLQAMEELASYTRNFRGVATRRLVEEKLRSIFAVIAGARELALARKNDRGETGPSHWADAFTGKADESFQMSQVKAIAWGILSDWLDGDGGGPDASPKVARGVPEPEELGHMGAEVWATLDCPDGETWELGVADAHCVPSHKTRYASYQEALGAAARIAPLSHWSHDQWVRIVE